MKNKVLLFAATSLMILAVLALPFARVQASPTTTSQNPFTLLARAAQAYQRPLSAQSVSAFEVVASELNNPRGLAFGPDGTLYVAEAGVGGSDPCVVGPEGNTVCVGATGSITRVKDGVQDRFVTGLPSLGDPTSGGFASTGPSDVSPRLQGLDVIVNLGADPAARDTLGPMGPGFGRMVRVLKSGIWAYTADVSAHEANQNPEPSAVDSNPYSLVLVQNGMRAVADAGGNDVVGVFVNGRTETMAVFPPRMVEAPPFLGLPPGAMMPMDAVPNAITKGPDGALYVGQLTGFPFPVGGANVYRLAGPGMQPEVYAEGFTNIIDIAFDKDGNLYVLEITHNGLLSEDLTGGLIKVAPDGTQTILATDGLVAPGGLTIGPDGMIYISNFGIFPGAGEVIRMSPNPTAAAVSAQFDAPDAMDAPFQVYIPILKH